MAYRLPPLSAVRLFEAAGRLLSFKAAAEELHVTPSAISHGVQTLEEWLGAPLFLRGQRGLSLTDAGVRFLQPVQQALQGLATATENLPGRKATGALSVSAPPTFASRWLLPRLKRFSTRYPDIEVAIDTELRQVELRQGDVDLAIRMAPEARPGGTWLRLVREVFVPVCAPSLLDAFRSRSAETILHRAPLIHLTTASEDWAWWFGAPAWAAGEGQRFLQFDTARMAFEAAAQGLGIALGRKPLVDDDIASGRLVEIAGPPRQGATCYWLVGEEATFKRAEARLFRRWLIDELARADAVEPAGTGERAIA